MRPSEGNCDGATTPCLVGAQRFRLAELGAGDEAELLRLFTTAFGHSPTPDWYAWKYGAGDGEAVGLWDEDNHLVANYSGFPRELRWLGTPVPAIQIGDVMVAPEVRGLLTRKGPLFQVCSRFFASRVGNGKKYRLAFGFPNERHMRLGVALDLYHDAGIIHQISWPARQEGTLSGWRWSPLVGKDVERHVTRAWRSMSRDLADCVVGVRNAAYVRQRFLDRPDRHYRFFCLRRWPLGDTLALVIMAIEQGRAELLDVIGARAVFPIVARAAAMEAGQAGAATLTAWASPLVLAAFGGSGAEITGQAAHLAVAKASNLTADEVATAPWWWMGGDTDFL